MSRIIEIRSYNLKPGTRETFDQVANGEVRPMLMARGTDVVAMRASMADESTYDLIRAYRDVSGRDACLAGF